MQDMRLGRFKVSCALLGVADHKTLDRLSHNLTILESKYDMVTDCQNYVANHPDFELVEMNQVIPEYVAIFINGSDSVKWEKV